MQLATLLLLSTWPQAQVAPHNFSFLQLVMQRAAEQAAWSNTPIFVTRHMPLDPLNGLISWLHGNLSVASYLFDGHELPDRYNPLRNHIKSDALSLLFCQSSEEFIWWHMDQRLRKLRVSRLIVFLAAQLNDSGLRHVFEQIWSLQFMQALVLHRQRIYAYTPYPVLRYFELKLEKNVVLFPAPTSNLQGYVVSTPAENDLPRVFLMRDPRTGRRLIRGYGYRTFEAFLCRHNAQLHVSNAEQAPNIGDSVNMSRINGLIGQQRLEISMHPYVGIDQELGIISYPLIIAQNCLIMPVRNEIPRYMYLLRPFHWSSWLLLSVGVFYISLALYWLSPGLEASPGLRATHCLLESLSQLLFVSTTTQIYRPSIRYFFVALQLSVLGFIVTNWYSNQLSSSLTATLAGEQVNTFEQLIAQQQRILAKHHEVPMVLEQVPPHLEKQIARLIVGVEAGEQVRALLSFNQSFSYPFTVERWRFFAKQQQYAAKPIYRYSSVCLGAPTIGFPMRLDSHLETPLKHFIMRVQSTGLLHHWIVSDFNDALRAGYVRLIDNEVSFRALDMDSLRLGWYVLLCGLLLAAVVFLCEHGYNTWH